jgi:hypothetical protein
MASRSLLADGAITIEDVHANLDQLLDEIDSYLGKD